MGKGNKPPKNDKKNKKAKKLGPKTVPLAGKNPFGNM